MIIYCDGSTRPGEKSTTIAYGVVVHHNNETHELNGRYDLSLEYVGLHEVVAFVEAMLFAESHGVDPKDVSVYTDDQFVSYAHFYLHPGNYRSKETHSMFGKLHLLDRLYNQPMVERMLGWLGTVRVSWVKGHRLCVDQNRVDHLARKALQRKDVLHRDEWVRSGFSLYRDGKPCTVYAPFSNH